MPPKRVYYVSMTTANGPKVSYGKRGGGLFGTLAGAEDRAASHNKAGRDAIVLYADVEWKNPYEPAQEG